MKFQSVIPVLYSSDIVRSLTYYVEKLGFENKWEWGSPPTFGGVYKDDVSIFFCENGQGNPGTWICLNVENVDRFYEMAKANGAIILSAPEDKEWSMREMLIKDPDGHIIRVGHGIECD